MGNRVKNKPITCKECGQTVLKESYKTDLFCTKKCSGNFRRRKPIFNFSKVTAESAYWAGFIFGDGYVSENKLGLCLAKNESNKKLLKELSIFLMGYDVSREYKLCLSFKVRDLDLVNNLKKFGIIKNKTYDGTLILPKYHKKHFIRGYFDADGWISVGRFLHKGVNKYYPRYCLGICSYLEENLLIINEELPIKGTISKKRTQELYELRFGSKLKINKICRYLNGSPNLERKWTKITSNGLLLPN